MDLLMSGQPLSKYDLAAMAPCSLMAAYKNLQSIHAMNKDVRICKWTRINDQPIPVYAKGTTEDAKRPEMSAEYLRYKHTRKPKEAS